MKTREEHQNPDLSFFHGRLPYTGHYSIELPASTTAPAASKSFADGWTIFAVGSVLSDTPNPLDAVHKAVSRSSNSDLAALNGSFCFVAINETIQKAVLAVDRLATRPIYFEPAAHGVRFSSDLRSFGRGNLNLSAAAGVLASGHVHNDDTWIRGVYYLRPGHYVCIEQGRHTVEKYWDYQLRPVDYDLETRQTRLAELLIQAVERRTRSSNVGLFLSGGYDSRAILGACLELGRPVTLLSFGGNSEPGSDYAIARTIADVTGLPFVALDYVPPSIQDAVRQTTLPFGAMRYPIQEMTAFANFPAHLDTVLFGEEAFGRIPYPLRTPEDALFALGIRNLSDVGVWRKILRPAAYRELCHLQAESLKKMVNRARSCPDLHAVKDYIYVTERMPRSGLMARQFVNQFAEVSYPWLDSEVLDFMSTVPSSLRIGKTLYKKTIRQMFPRVFELPMGNARSDLRPNIGTYALSGLPETAALFDESALTAHYNGKSGLHVRLFQRVLETVTGRPRELLKQFYSIGSRSSLVRQARGSCISHVDVLTRVAMADFAIGQSLAPSLLQE